MTTVETSAATIEEAVDLALRQLGIDAAEVSIQVTGRKGLFATGGHRTATVRLVIDDPPGGRRPPIAHDAERAATDAPAAATAAPVSPLTPDDSTADTMTPDDLTSDHSDLESTEPETPETTEPDGATPEDLAAPADTTPADTSPDGDVGAADEETSMSETLTDEPDFDELTPEQRMELLDEESELAADFLEGLLDLMEVPGDIEIEVTEGSAVVNISDVGSGLLIGRRGATLDALQELVRSTTQRQTERRSHVRVDVEGYRSRQLDKFRSRCRDAIAQVRETGEPVRLEPMDAYERKMMHDVVARTGGVTSSSEGTEPKRRVVVHPASA